MATKTIAPEAIWTALVSDPLFNESGPEEWQLQFRPFVEDLAEILDPELVVSPVTISSVMKAKMAFLRHCIDKGLVKVIAEATGSLEYQVEMSLNNLVAQLEPFVEDAEAFLQENGLSQEEFLASDAFNIRPEVLEQINQGMTIGDLLITQPSVIVINPS